VFFNKHLPKTGCEIATKRALGGGEKISAENFFRRTLKTPLQNAILSALGGGTLRRLKKYFLEPPENTLPKRPKKCVG